MSGHPPQSSAPGTPRGGSSAAMREHCCAGGWFVLDGAVTDVIQAMCGPDCGPGTNYGTMML
jgi:hypothetical protein